MPYVRQDNSKPDTELIKKYTTFHFAHQYDKTNKKWQFKGYTCTKCGRTVQNPNIVPRHASNCTNGPTIYKQDPIPEQIVNVFGAIWQPFDVNVRKLTKHG